MLGPISCTLGRVWGCVTYPADSSLKCFAKHVWTGLKLTGNSEIQSGSFVCFQELYHHRGSRQERWHWSRLFNHRYPAAASVFAVSAATWVQPMLTSRTHPLRLITALTDDMHESATAQWNRKYNTRETRTKQEVRWREKSKWGEGKQPSEPTERCWLYPVGFIGQDFNVVGSERRWRRTGSDYGAKMIRFALMNAVRKRPQQKEWVIVLIAASLPLRLLPLHAFLKIQSCSLTPPPSHPPLHGTRLISLQIWEEVGECQ